LWVGSSGKLTVRNSTITENTGGGNGAAFYSYQGICEVTIIDSVISNNAGRWGSAYLFRGGEVVRIINTIFSNNPGDFGRGGLNFFGEAKHIYLENVEIKNGADPIIRRVGPWGNECNPPRNCIPGIIGLFNSSDCRKLVCGTYTEGVSEYWNNSYTPTGSGVFVLTASQLASRTTLVTGVLNITGTMNGFIYPSISGNDRWEIFRVPDASKKLHLLRIKLEKGRQFKNLPDNGGGSAISVIGGTATLTDCIISNNNALNNGAALFVSSSGTLSVRNTTISGNTGAQTGGAIINGGHVTIIDSIISNNYGRFGGAYYGSGGSTSSLRIVSTVISGNTGQANNGGFSGSLEKHVYFENVDFKTSTDKIIGSWDAECNPPTSCLPGIVGLYNTSSCSKLVCGHYASEAECNIPTSGSATINSDCILYSEIVVTGSLNITGVPDAQGNLPKIIGGGSNRLFKVQSGGELVVKYLNLTGGDLNDNGGAIYIYYAGDVAVNIPIVTITSSYIVGNEASEGGGIFSIGGAYVTITNTTIKDNRAKSGTYKRGGGIFFYDHFFNFVPVLRINDSLIESNTASGAGNECGGGGIWVGNLVQLVASNTKFNNNVAGCDRGNNIQMHKGSDSIIPKVFLINCEFSGDEDSFGGYIYSGSTCSGRKQYCGTESCSAAPTQCADNGYTPHYACVDKPNPNEGVECKPQCPIPTSGSATITSDCTLFSQFIVTGKLNVTGIPDAQGNLPKIIGGGSNRLFKVESGGELVVKFLNLTGGKASSTDLLGADGITPWTTVSWCYTCGNDLDSQTPHPCPSVAAAAGHPLLNAPTAVSEDCYYCRNRKKYKGVNISEQTYCCPNGWEKYGDGSRCSAADQGYGSSEDGGAILVNGGMLHTSNVIVCQNEAGIGGGVGNNEGTVVIFNSTVSENYAHWGAGLHCKGNARVSFSNIEGNLAGVSGGGAYCATGSTCFFEAITFKNNRANGAVRSKNYDGGAAVHTVSNAVLVIKDSSFADNAATVVGANDIFTRGYTATMFLMNLKFRDNLSSSYSFSGDGCDGGYCLPNSCSAAPTQCADKGYKYHACIDKSNPKEGVECKPRAPTTTTDPPTTTERAEQSFSFELPNGLVLSGGSAITIKLHDKSKPSTPTFTFINKTKVYIGPYLLTYSDNTEVSNDGHSIENVLVPSAGVCQTNLCEMWMPLILESMDLNTSFSKEVYYVQESCTKEENEACHKVKDMRTYPRSKCLLRTESKKCIFCPEGARCPGGNQLWPLPGFGLNHLGEVVPCKAPSSRCLGYDEKVRTELCAEGYGGLLCGGCIPGYFSYPVGVNYCLVCPERVSPTMAVISAIIVPLLVMLAMFAGILLVALGGSYIAAKINGGTVSGGLFRTVDFALYFFLSVSLLSQVSRVCLGKLPPYMEDMAVHLSILQFDISGTVPPDCTDFPFLKEAALFYFSTVCIVFLTVTLFKGIRSELIISAGKLNKFRHASLIWLCISYSLMINFAFRSLYCIPVTNNDNREVYVLASNTMVQCYEGKHRNIVLPATLGFVVHGIFFPIFSYFIVRKVRKKHIRRSVSPVDIAKFDKRLVWKYFLNHDYVPAKFWFRQVELGLFFWSSFCNEVLAHESHHIYTIVYILSLSFTIGLYCKLKPYKASAKWKLPVRVYLSVCTLMYVITNYSSSQIAITGVIPNFVLVVAPITMGMTILLFLVLVVAYGATLVNGAKKEQKLIVKEQARRFSSIRWSSNPAHGMTTRGPQREVEMQRQKPQILKEVSDAVAEETLEGLYDGDTGDTELTVYTQYFEHYDRGTKSSYYECKRTSTAWRLPGTCGDEGEHIEINTVHNSENEEYYVIERSTTSWTKPAGINDIIVVSAPPGTQTLQKCFSKSKDGEGDLQKKRTNHSPGKKVVEEQRPQKRRNSNKIDDQHYKKTLKYARNCLSKIKNGEMAAPKDVVSADGWWQLLDEDGNTCYLDTRTGQCKYELPKNWVKLISKQFERQNSRKKTGHI
jgi:hypothetical protein